MSNRRSSSSRRCAPRAPVIGGKRVVARLTVTSVRLALHLQRDGPARRLPRGRGADDGPSRVNSSPRRSVCSSSLAISWHSSQNSLKRTRYRRASTLLDLVRRSGRRVVEGRTPLLVVFSFRRLSCAPTRRSNGSSAGPPIPHTHTRAPALPLNPPPDGPSIPSRAIIGVHPQDRRASFVSRRGATGRLASSNRARRTCRADGDRLGSTGATPTR